TPGESSIDVLDDLQYSYSGNKLIKVMDAGTDGGFKDGVDQSEEYTYDENGNMLSDLNKGISAIDYNFYNLPEKIIFDEGQTIKYIYDAGGNKLRKELFDDSGSLLKHTDYIGGLVYENDTLRHFPHAAGRVIVSTDSEPSFEYQYSL